MTKFDEVCPGAVDDASRAERLFDSEAMTEQRRAAEALWLELEACQAAVSACYPSAEQLREEAAEDAIERVCAARPRGSGSFVWLSRVSARARVQRSATALGRRAEPAV